MNSIDMTNKVKQPAHVPNSLVYEFDYNKDPAYWKDPPARAADLVKNAPPIFWTPYNGGHWIVLAHAAVSDAMRDYATFSSEHFSAEDFQDMMAQLPEEERIPAPIPICIDPPSHTKLRQPLQSTFSPKTLATKEADIRALAERLIDAIAKKGRCEFQHDVSDVYPVEIFLGMFGLPVEKEREYRALAVKHLTVISPDLAENFTMMQSIASVLRDTIIDRRDNPKNDIISLLWSLTVEGEPMTLDLMLSYCTILFVAGLDTVVNALGFAVRHLAMDTKLQNELRANPSLIPDAIEEILRRYSFVAPFRVTKKDTQLHGVTIKQDERVMMFIPGASLDPTIYTDPTSVNIQRESHSHLSFGTGPHHCLGAHLARLELKIMYETILKKLPEFRLDPEHPPTFHGSIIAGPSTVNLVWNV